MLMHDLTRVGDAAYDAADARIAERLEAVALGAGRVAASTAPPEVHLSTRQLPVSRVLHVYNKLDLATAAPPANSLAISALTGGGIDVLRRELLARAGWHAQPEGVFIARARHLDALRRTAEHLAAAQQHAAAGDAVVELFAEELRLAHDALGEITGAFTSDDLLGVIFSRFCIGK